MKRIIINKELGRVTFADDRCFIRMHQPTAASMQRMWQQYIKTSTGRKPGFQSLAADDTYIISSELIFLGSFGLF